MCGAHRSNDLDHSFAAAAPAALIAWPKSIDVPLSGPKRQNSPEKGRARARGAAPAVARPYRHLDPSEQPSRCRAGPRPLPSSAWIGFALPYRKGSEKARC